MLLKPIVLRLVDFFLRVAILEVLVVVYPAHVGKF